MKKLAVCTVGVVLALLLGGVNNQASIKDDSSQWGLFLILQELQDGISREKPTGLFLCLI